MNVTDKNYVDRLHNQQVNELNEIKNRLLVLEGKPTVAIDGKIQVEIDTEKVYEMFLKACHDCLQQRQERLQEEDRQAAEKLRQECEAKGERYIANVHEWRAAIARDYDDFFNKMLAVARINDRHYRDIRAALLKLAGEPPASDAPASNSPSNSAHANALFSNLPSGFKPKLSELHHRLTLRIRTYLTGSFTLHRGWTIFTVLLYITFLIIFICLRLTIIAELT